MESHEKNMIKQWNNKISNYAPNSNFKIYQGKTDRITKNNKKNNHYEKI